MLAMADPDLDNGPRTDRSATMRMCAVSREVRPIDELIRFVVSPQGNVIPDLKRKLPGRGLWVSASRRTVAEAVRRNQFSKGFKRDVRAAPTLPADTETLLVRSATEALAKATGIVRSIRQPGSPRHQLNQLAPERWLRAEHIADPSPLGLTRHVPGRT